MAYKIPSIKRKRPKAMINSFIILYYWDLGFIFPKNLKNSLSGDNIKDVSVLLANANKDSEIMKGQGDGERNKIFADAFGRDPEFFAFYRAMQAYETALIGGDTSVILSPDSEFFKFFGNIKPCLLYTSDAADE